MFSGFPSAFDTIIKLQQAMDRATSANFFGHATTQRGGFPPVNILNIGERLLVTTELPGVAREDLNLEIKKDLIRISGERKLAFDENVSVHRRERSSGKFDRTIKAPFTIDPDNVGANLRNGILSIEIAPHTDEMPHKIAIN